MSVYVAVWLALETRQDCAGQVFVPVGDGRAVFEGRRVVERKQEDRSVTLPLAVPTFSPYRTYRAVSALRSRQLQERAGQAGRRRLPWRW
jgi:hypothetical protein